MDTMNDIKVYFELADDGTLHLVHLISLTKQTEQEKYEMLEPVLNMLDSYTDLLVILLKKVCFAHYDKQERKCLIALKNSPHLLILNLEKHELRIYVDIEAL